MFQFYKSTIMTCAQCRQQAISDVSILQKYDYDVPSSASASVITWFQFYKSTIMTSSPSLLLVSAQVSILQKYDYDCRLHELDELEGRFNSTKVRL